MTNITIALEDWEYKLLESLYENVEEDIKINIKQTIFDHKNIILDRFIDYHKKNNTAISYENEEDLINKSYEIGIIRNLSQLNKEFIENN